MTYLARLVARARGELDGGLHPRQPSRYETGGLPDLSLVDAAEAGVAPDLPGHRPAAAPTVPGVPSSDAGALMTRAATHRVHAGPFAAGLAPSRAPATRSVVTRPALAPDPPRAPAGEGAVGPAAAEVSPLGGVDRPVSPIAARRPSAPPVLQPSVAHPPLGGSGQRLANDGLTANLPALEVFAPQRSLDRQPAPDDLVGTDDGAVPFGHDAPDRPARPGRGGPARDPGGHTVIEVTIGRVEVQGTGEPRAHRAPRPRPAPPLSLEQFLAERRGS